MLDIYSVCGWDLWEVVQSGNGSAEKGQGQICWKLNI